MNTYAYYGDVAEGISLKDTVGGKGLYFADTFNRIVHGGRGDYVEFSADQLPKRDQFRIPEGQEWRVDSDVAFYIELRYYGVKIYLQKKTVDYADYRIGCYYVSPKDLCDFKIIGRRENVKSQTV